MTKSMKKSLKGALSCFRPFKPMARLTSSPSPSSTENATSERDCNCVSTNPRRRSVDSLREIKLVTRRCNKVVDNLCVECPETDMSGNPKAYDFLADYFDAFNPLKDVGDFLKEGMEHPHQLQRLINGLFHNFEEEIRNLRGDGWNNFEEEIRNLREDGSFVKTLASFESLKEYCEGECLPPDFIEKLEMCHTNLVAIKGKLSTKHFLLNLKIGFAEYGGPLFSLLGVPATMFLGPTVGIAISTTGSQILNTSSWCKHAKTKDVMITAMENAIRLSLQQIEKVIKSIKKLDSDYQTIVKTAQDAVERRSPVNVAMRDMVETNKHLIDEVGSLDQFEPELMSSVKPAVAKSHQMIAKWMRKG